MAFKKLHKNGSYKPEDLQNVKEYKDLVKKTYDVFNIAITDNDMPEDMSRALQSDAFLFGGLKANAQLFEASQLLLNTDGTLKPFKELSNQFEKLNVQYNQNYLEAEYQFAVTSSQMAAKWVEFGSEDRYNLQYRTAKDERVRLSHKNLADITLPKTDAFWISYYPPNGWNCRCTVVEVLKGKYEKSDSGDSMVKGEAATTEIGKNGKNRLEMFRFNPGIQKIVFPPKNTYQMMVGANQVKSQSLSNQKAERKAKDSELKQWASSNIKKGSYISIKSKEFEMPEVRISRSNIENLLKHIANIDDKEIVKDIVKILKQSIFKEGKEIENKNSKNYGDKIGRGVLRYNYYKSSWRGRDLEINMEVMKNGYEQPYTILFDKK